MTIQNKMGMQSHHQLPACVTDPCTQDNQWPAKYHAMSLLQGTAVTSFEVFMVAVFGL
jgi:hypothetical protein